MARRFVGSRVFDGSSRDRLSLEEDHPGLAVVVYQPSDVKLEQSRDYATPAEHEKANRKLLEIGGPKGWLSMYPLNTLPTHSGFLWPKYEQIVSISLEGYKQDMNGRFGMLYFSERWHNPVLWSHYAERHQGICLDFDIERRCVKRVVYLRQRPRLSRPLSQEDSEQLLYTKFVDWQYEEEWRSWVRLDERDPTTGLYFYPFDNRVRLREVIAGPLCSVGEAKLKDALRGYAYEISPIKARLAFRTFQIVKNREGFLQNPTEQLT